VKQYVTPEIEIFKFSTEDVITTSAGLGTGVDDGENEV
jgi:hypothetical protein